MASHLPGFEYDIFISYRHNDNLDGWVTDFVQNLEKELRGTLKETLSIYFDKNPQDGLLETHHVDKSLEGKLKCLIFIPIISQTYCDPKSFAWQHEFCVFNKISQQDQFGRDIKLSNGNVASRILPIKIHELDSDDNVSIEHEIAGVLRAIDFIYTEAGVNRPLRPNDENPNKNQNHNAYRNQVNKVANAVKDIIGVLRNPPDQQPLTTTCRTATIKRSSNRQYIGILAASVVIGLASYFIYLQSSVTDRLTLEKSIAVLAFVNMSNDPEQEYISDGISEEILNLLAKVPGLKVIGRTSSFYFKGKNEDLRVIGKKLDVANILEGSVRKDGNRIRVTTKLIRADDGSQLWSETYDQPMQGIFALQDNIAGDVLARLKLKLLGTSSMSANPTTDTTIHNLILKGNYFYDRGKFNHAKDFYQSALVLDSNNVRALTSLANVIGFLAIDSASYYHQGFALVRKYSERAILLNNQSAESHRAMGIVKAFYDYDWQGARNELNKAIELEPGNSNAFRNLGQLETMLGNQEAAIGNFKKAFELNPLNVINIGWLADAYTSSSRFDEAINVLEGGLELESDRIQFGIAETYLLMNKPQEALKHLEQIHKDRPLKIFINASCHSALGEEKQANQLFIQLLKDSSLTSFARAQIYCQLKQYDKAFQELEHAYSEKYGMYELKYNPFLKDLRTDARYRDLLHKMNLPQ
jgi:TolB-like protein